MRRQQPWESTADYADYVNSFSEQTMAEMPSSTRDLFTVRFLVQGIRRNTTRAYLIEHNPSTFARAKLVALKFEELLEKGIVDKSKYPPDDGKPHNAS